MAITPEVLVSEARLWLGTPYLHQASARGLGCDCLGLLRGVWREVVGAEPETIPPYTRDWSEASGHELLWQAALRWLLPCEGPLHPGDVLLFRMRQASVAKHLGIATRLNAGMGFIHAYDGYGVVESPLTDPWSRRIVARFAFPS